MGVGGHQHLEALKLGRSEQLAVFECGPTQLVCRDHLMIQQQVAQRCGCALIEQDAHLRRSQRTARGVTQHGTRLFQRNARKQINELADRHTIFEVLEER
jgi:hypothetical protein